MEDSMEDSKEDSMEETVTTSAQGAEVARSDTLDLKGELDRSRYCEPT